MAPNPYKNLLTSVCVVQNDVDSSHNPCFLLVCIKGSGKFGTIVSNANIFKTTRPILVLKTSSDRKTRILQLVKISCEMLKKRRNCELFPAAFISSENQKKRVSPGQ